MHRNCNLYQSLRIYSAYFQVCLLHTVVVEDRQLGAGIAYAQRIDREAIGGLYPNDLMFPEFIHVDFDVLLQQYKKFRTSLFA